MLNIKKRQQEEEERKNNPPPQSRYEPELEGRPFEQVNKQQTGEKYRHGPC